MQQTLHIRMNYRLKPLRIQPSSLEDIPAANKLLHTIKVMSSDKNVSLRRNSAFRQGPAAGARQYHGAEAGMPKDEQNAPVGA